jgi:hypothetical protein
MKFIFYDRFTVFTSQWFRVCFFCLLRVHVSHHFLPFYDGVAFASISVY